MTAGSDERTRNATDLPAAAQANPFDGQPGTIPATDLPAAAGVVPAPPSERPSGKRPRVTEDAESTRIAVRASALNPLSISSVRKSGERKAEPKPNDPDDTSPRPVPLSALARNAEKEVEETRVLPDQDWRTSMVDVPPRPEVLKPRPFSLTRGAAPFVMGGTFLVFALVVAYINVAGTERSVRRGWNLVPVVVAADNLSEGTTVDGEMIATRDVPEQFVTSSVVRPDSVGYVLNQRIMVPVQAGDPLLWSQFEAARATERLSRRVRTRGRAYTIEARDIASVGGWVRPGDHVDIVISVRDPLSRERKATTTLQNIPVLATGHITASTNIGMLSATDREYNDISFMVLPEEVDILALMGSKASYRLVLRNDDDYEQFESGQSTMETLLSGRRVEMLQQKRFKTIQMIRRAKTEGQR
jgi:pilus assembly protein CpaB